MKAINKQADVNLLSRNGKSCTVDFIPISSNLRDISGINNSFTFTVFYCHFIVAY